MKTIKELNEKIWYRTIKVIYILIYLIIFIVISFIFYENSNIKIEEYEKNSISKLYNQPGSKDYTEKELDIAKQVKEQGGTEDDFLDVIEQIRNKEIKNDVIKVIYKFSIQKFLIKELIFILFGYLIFFQIINRIFYYITLGMFNPKN